MFSTIDEITAELRAGRMIVLTDDESRENEGDLVLPARFMTPEAVTFMLKEAKGYLCLSLTEADCDRLDLTPQAAVNTSVRGTPFTVSIDGHPKHGLTTGVSAKERAKTIQLAIDPATGPADFVRPGHINPLRSRDGGVLVRIGQTEGSLDLCRLAGLYPAAAIIEIMKDDGEMARVPDLEAFCKQHTLKMCSVRQIIEHRLAGEPFIHRLEPIEGTPIDTPLGRFNCVVFRSLVDPLPHLALTVGDVGRLGADGNPVETDEPTLVRVHRRDLLGDIFDDLTTSGSADGPTSTGQLLRQSMRMIQEAGRGVIIYLRPHGVGDSLSQRLTRPFGHDTADTPSESVPHTTLEYGTGSQILRSLGIKNLRLITNSEADYPQLQAFGLTITERVPVVAEG
ncbi:3,4-dihydroxy-2-butanone 4-phosphate synthase / GTP cyclohydrolase II [hydrothermal vent metagenome]|uniref:3,4-dihydroxy-2-butanone 4-phosphate synthase / GTP cyclohydrolase II n=1 Tax=hydrothermal vent metagenome TaxID=652676 RepID=A0A3B1DMW6_9ZZZZ